MNHIHRIVAIILLGAVIGFVAQRILRPEGFGVVGHFRVGGLFDNMDAEPVHQGQQACAECHPDVYELHEKDLHFGVQCEVCHGAGDFHVKYHLINDSKVSEEKAVLPKEYTLEGCLYCHRKLAARPSDFPQVDPVEHFAFLKVKEPTTECIACHSPHEPIFLLAKVAEARIHPIIYECNDCHDTKPTGNHKEVKNHPVIFTCQDCHSVVVEDFKKHEHSFMECTSCHLFHSENETAGRIFKNGNGKFCLLCHEKKSFKDESLPQIVSAEHLEEMAKDANLDPTTVKDDPRACLDCHFEFIHDSEAIKKGGVISAGQ
jgi:predicted CXXCH cytochrome family protein